MTFILIFALLLAVSVYWCVTQIMPERRKNSLLRPGLAEALVASLNEKRHKLGLPLLEMDEDLMLVAENKASHQLLTGRSEEGWEYPSEYESMFGRSLLMETLISGKATTMGERLASQRDVLDGEWIRCGIGVAGGTSANVVVAVILCREPWEPMAEVARHRSLLERFVMGR
ncbi:MAG TPA: hypothetical protein VF221_20500 [Chloroflexota bacterium]